MISFPIFLCMSTDIGLGFGSLNVLLLVCFSSQIKISTKVFIIICFQVETWGIHSCLRSCEKIGKLFQVMFNDSKIADLFKLWKTKWEYFINMELHLTSKRTWPKKSTPHHFILAHLMRHRKEFSKMNKLALRFAFGMMRKVWLKQTS